eukprot:TRINITY_DN6100_c0_g1_i1.p1 TRINITY_DN6100_c0_g1~~TRINITY_DN6100_c0_g1_i1.p1  ORF type:complete len:779 (-),score=156.88 TRINITY_DN6100_c0_g1_i1:97-2433(-)
MGESNKTISVLFNGNQVPVDVDDDLNAEMFQAILFSIFQVPIEQQQILLKEGVWSEDIDLSKLDEITLIQNEQQISTQNTENNNSKDVVVFQEDIDAWQTTCTRVFLGSEVLQPGFNVKGKKCCYACGTTCHLPNEITPILELQNSFACQCSDISECLFSPRVQSGFEKATGKLKEMMSQSLANAHKTQVERIKAAQRNMSQDTDQKQKEMIAKLNSGYSQVLMYENPELQAKALSVIPLEVQSLPRGEKQIRDLLAWFKNDFFKWVNEPPCERCQSPTKMVGMGVPDLEETMNMANRVENYQCTNCSSFTRFPRYNNPGRLLETRKGRCGEWANAFTLCCRALGYDSRWIHDHTDHVWTEVFWEEKNRWVHLDPCENQMDTPLVYEKGWGKHLSYIFAFSVDGITDVIHRYSRKWNEAVKARRTNVDEIWLSTMISNINIKISQNLSEQRRSLVLSRMKNEMEELDKFKNGIEIEALPENEMHGRTSGSEEWRQQRGELGDGCGPLTDVKIPPPNLEKVLENNPSVLYINFSGTFSWLKTLGSASIILDPFPEKSLVRTDNKILRITPALNSQKGAVWFDPKVEFSTEGFTTWFTFRLGSNQGGGGSADGFAFVLQNSSENALGLEGYGLGYDGIRDGVAIEYDTWETKDRCRDPSPQHISIQVSNPLSANHQHSKGCTAYPLPIPGKFSMNDGKPHKTVIRYNRKGQSQMTIWLDGYLVLKCDVPDLFPPLKLDPSKNGEVYIGFTASTGGLSQNHDILEWSYATCPIEEDISTCP